MNSISARAPLATKFLPWVNSASGARQAFASGLMLLTMLLVTGCGQAPSGSQQTGVSAPSDTVQVQATGSAQGIPDQALLSFVIVEEGTELGVLKEAVDDTTTTFLEVLAGLQVPRANISSWQINVAPRYNYRDGEQQFLGYRVSRSVKVQLDDIANFDVVIDQALAADIGRVEQVQFQIADPSPLFAEARADAMAQAWQKAKELAAASNRSIARVHEVVEHGSAPAYAERSMALRAADSATEPGQQQLSVSVSVKFIFE